MPNAKGAKVSHSVLLTDSRSRNLCEFRGPLGMIHMRIKVKVSGFKNIRHIWTLDRERDFVVAPSSAGGNSTFEQHSQSTEERATLDRYHHFHGHSGLCSGVEKMEEGRKEEALRQLRQPHTAAHSTTPRLLQEYRAIFASPSFRRVISGEGFIVYWY